MIRSLVISFWAFVASRTVWISAACLWAASHFQLPEMTTGHALYSWDDGLRIAIALTVAYKQKSWYIRYWADGHDRKVRACDKHDHWSCTSWDKWIFPLSNSFHSIIKSSSLVNSRLVICPCSWHTQKLIRFIIPSWSLLYGQLIEHQNPM
jgi:hypothetical protein